jgi:hypothetical protein
MVEICKNEKYTHTVLLRAHQGNLGVDGRETL